MTPDRTTLIASTHRALAVSEKIVPGDGRADPSAVSDALDTAAARVIAFDMQGPAIASGSVISATLFGALAGSGTLPFAVDRFQDVVRGSGRGVEASLAAFQAGLDRPEAGSDADTKNGLAAPVGPVAETQAWAALIQRVEALPTPVHAMAKAGLAKVVDFQDPAYGTEYLDRLQLFVDLDTDLDQPVANAAAKHIANAMAYDDVIRVADLKTRASRFTRIADEMATDGRQMHLTEFMHPRAEEICATMPARLGNWVEARPRLVRMIDRIFGGGRRVRTDTVFGFIQLYFIAGIRRRRRGTLRHRIEMAHIAEWQDLALRTAPQDAALAVEILNSRRLIKGYSDTRVRGVSKYDRVLGALAMLQGRSDAADWLRRLRDAALQDADGVALEGALKTVASFSGDQADVTAAE